MNNFEFYSPAHLVFGKGVENKVGEMLKGKCHKVLLHFGGGSVKKSGLYDRVTASLEKAGIAYCALGGVVPNPRLSLVYEGIDLCKKENVDLILAVGGGSVIDSAKAIAMGVCYDGDVWDMYEKGVNIEKALPVVTVLTIPAAGSEASGDTVITNEEKQLKYGYGHNLLRPLMSFMNPELFFTLPENQVANGVSDMMSHVFERYFTNTTHVELTDRLCEATLKTIMHNAGKLMENHEDYDAWCEIGFAGTVAHNGLVGCGRDQDWGCHMMEHELSAIYDVAHGAGLAVLTPAWMKYVYKDNIPMFVQFATQVMGVEGSMREPEAIILEGIEKLRMFFLSIGQPATLSEMGIEEKDFEEMAKKCTGFAFGKEHPVGGLKKLYWQDVLNIYKLANE